MVATVKLVFAAVTIGAAVSAVSVRANTVLQSRGRYDENTQIAVNRCADAVQVRLEVGHYGNEDANGHGTARVLGIGGVGLPVSGKLTVSGIATSGRYASVAGGIRRPVDLVWRCSSDNVGSVSGISILSAPPTIDAGYDVQPNSYEGADYSRYGYRRY